MLTFLSAVPVAKSDVPVSRALGYLANADIPVSLALGLC